MAVDLGQVFFKINAKFINVDQALNKIEKVDRNSKQASKSLLTMGNAFRAAGAAAAVFAGVRLSKEFVAIADAGALVRNRLMAATDSTEEFERAYRGLLQISQKTGTVFKANVQLFQRLAISGKALKATQDELLTITDTVANLGRISGSSKEDILNSTRQLAQGLGSVFFRAEEFNSIIEQMPELITKVAEQMGMTRAEMQQAVRDGRLLSKDVFKGLIDSAEQTRKEAAKLPKTYEESFNTIKNGVLISADAINQMTNVTTTLAGAASTVGDLFVAAFNDTNKAAVNNTEAMANGRSVVITLAAAFLTMKEVGVQAAMTIEAGFDQVFDKIDDLSSLLDKIPGFDDIITSKSERDFADTFKGLEANANRLGFTLQDTKKKYSAMLDSNAPQEQIEGTLKAIVTLERAYEEARQTRDRFFNTNKEDITQGLANGFLSDSGGGAVGQIGKNLKKQFQDNLVEVEDLLASVKPIKFDADLVDREYTALEETGKEAAKVFSESFSVGVSSRLAEDLNSALDTLGEGMSQTIAGKILGKDTDFKAIAKTYVESLLTSIIDAMLISPLITNLQTTISGALAGSTAQNGQTVFGGSSGTGAGGIGDLGGIFGLLGGAIGLPSIGTDALSTAAGAVSNNTDNRAVNINVVAKDATSFQSARGRIESEAKQMLRNS